MMPIDAIAKEEAVSEMLQRTGPCCFDDLVRSLPNLSLGEVLVAVERMSRDGRLLVRKRGYSTYQIILPSQLG
jgi:hypothetical protein